MQFIVTIDLPDDDFLAMDNREVAANALTRVARDLSYDRIYKRPMVPGTDAPIEILDAFSQLERVGKWEVRG